MSETTTKKANLPFWGTLGLLIGNLIGAGILALPIPLGLAGFIPALVIILLYGGMLLFAAFILADEAIEAHSPYFDLNSLYHSYLKGWHWIASALLLFVTYGTLVAYITGGAKVLCSLLDLKSDSIIVSLSLAVVMIIITCLKTSWIEKCNLALVVLMFAAFGLIVIQAESTAKIGHLFHTDWFFSLCSISMVVTAFKYHNIIPTICTSMKYNKKAIYTVLALGMVAAFVLNVVWFQAAVCNMPLYEKPDDNVVLSVTKNIPIHEVRSLLASYHFNLPANIPLSNISESKVFLIAGAIFSLIAIVTSFIGNGLSLRNFLRDIIVNTFGKSNPVTIAIIAFAPPTVVAIIWPNIFLKILGAAGGIGTVSLFGIFPCVIAIINKRYKLWVKIIGWFFLFLAVIALAFNLLHSLNIHTIKSRVEIFYYETYVRHNKNKAIKDLATEEIKDTGKQNGQGISVPEDIETQSDETKK